MPNKGDIIEDPIFFCGSHLILIHCEYVCLRHSLRTDHRIQLYITIIASYARFESPAGGTMPEVCQDTYHCGTHAPVWLNGKICTMYLTLQQN